MEISLSAWKKDLVVLAEKDQQQWVKRPRGADQKGKWIGKEPRFVYKAETDKIRRNAAECYRTLKNRVLMNCLRETLPPNTNRQSYKKRKMNQLDVIRRAVRYIKILTDTLAINDVTQQSA